MKEKCIVEHFACADRDMDVNPATRRAERSHGVCFYQVRPERNECRRATVHDEYGILGQKPVYEGVIATPFEDAALIEEVDLFGCKEFVLPQGPIDRIAVYTAHRLAA